VAGSRLTSLTQGRTPLVAICVFVACLGVWNAAHYPTGSGYDAAAHMSYADGLIPGWKLPHDTGEYYTPPGFYFLAGSVDWVARELGSGDPDRAGQVLNIVYWLGTILLVAALARGLWPGRRRIELGAAAFIALLPVVVETEAMFHPDPLSLLLSTLALWLCVRTFANPRYALALGITLGAAQLVRAFALWTVGAVFLALLAGRRWRELAVVVVLSVVIPAPWYIHQRVTYGGQPEFSQPAQPTPLPARFYFGLGIPGVITKPYRSNHLQWIPVAYDGLFGDYFGAWIWHSGAPTGKTSHVKTPSAGQRHRLVFQELLGLFPTLVALTGWLLMARAALRRPQALAVVLLPAVAVVGYVYFAATYWTSDGDLLKTSYMLSAAGAWALAFGYALDRLRGRAWPIVLVLLGISALVGLPFIVY
jgi:4-amino-4-deoxy-L-arabinose transferase-like glycosyltransferase